MSFRRIPTIAFATGKVASQILLFIVRKNFSNHETRLSELESTGREMPTGFILGWGAAAAPTGYLLCDGSVVDRASYPSLFAVCETKFNTGGETSTQFRLPDGRGRALIGSGTGSGLTARSVGDLVGSETNTLVTGNLPVHSHSVATPTHSHPGVYIQGSGAGNSWHPANFNDLSAPSATTNPSVTGVTLGNAGSGAAHANVQPSLVVNFIVKT